MPIQPPLPGFGLPALPFNPTYTQGSFFPAPPTLPPPPTNFLNALPTSTALATLPAPPPAPPANFINAMPRPVTSTVPKFGDQNLAGAQIGRAASGSLSPLRSLSSFGPQITSGALASRLPANSFASKALTGGGAKATALRRGAAGLGIQALGEIAQRVQGDTSADPTSALGAFTRGATGGASLGMAAGPIGAAVGGLGAGLGNLGGYLATGGEGHLGNIPGIGGLFGGGSGANAQSGPDLSPDGLKAKLDSFGLPPEVREQVKNAFNRQAADLRAQGIPLEQATRMAYAQFFEPKMNQDGSIAENALALQARDEAAAQGPQVDPAVAAQQAAQQEAARAVAFQALLSEIAPQVMGPDVSDQDRQFLAALPLLWGANQTREAQAAAAKQQAMVEEQLIRERIRQQSAGSSTDLESLLAE